MIHIKRLLLGSAFLALVIAAICAVLFGVGWLLAWILFYGGWHILTIVVIIGYFLWWAYIFGSEFIPK